MLHLQKQFLRKLHKQRAISHRHVENLIKIQLVLEKVRRLKIKKYQKHLKDLIEENHRLQKINHEKLRDRSRAILRIMKNQKLPQDRLRKPRLFQRQVQATSPVQVTSQDQTTSPDQATNLDQVTSQDQAIGQGKGLCEMLLTRTSPVRRLLQQLNPLILKSHPRNR